VSDACGGGAGMDSVPASFSWLRLRVILHVRKVMGCLRDSINLSTDSPDGSMKFAEMISFVKLSFSRIGIFIFALSDL
jgi:hypothetical protein